MVRDGVLTSADIIWKSTGSPSQCLVTWEVFGGGIMGNLLTDTPEAQLSLWSDSKYHIQVTCKNKVNRYVIRHCTLDFHSSRNPVGETSSKWIAVQDFVHAFLLSFSCSVAAVLRSPKPSRHTYRNACRMPPADVAPYPGHDHRVG